MLVLSGTSRNIAPLACFDHHPPSANDFQASIQLPTREQPQQSRPRNGSVDNPVIHSSNSAPLIPTIPPAPTLPRHALHLREPVDAVRVVPARVFGVVHSCESRCQHTLLHQPHWMNTSKQNRKQQPTLNTLTPPSHTQQPTLTLTKTKRHAPYSYIQSHAELSPASLLRPRVPYW